MVSPHDHGDALSGTALHYLAELYRLGGGGKLVSPSDLAEELNVSPPAVARMVGRLEELGMVAREPYKGIRLTERGARSALLNIRAHRLAEAFLVRVMEYGWEEAHDLADALAEIGDEEFVNRMEAKAGFPTRCPHGEPIPSRQGEMPVIHDCPLTELQVGQQGRISRVRLREPEKLRYLAEVGLVPETPFEIAGRGPFNGPVRLRLTHGEYVLGTDMAQRIFVETGGERI